MINRKYNTTLRDTNKEDDEGVEVQVTEYPYFDDNLDFAGSTDNVVDSRTGRFIAIIDFDSKGEGAVRLCPNCETYGAKIRLGVKIVESGEKRPSDWDQWLQCHTCYKVYPRFKIETQKTLRATTEKHEEENPFDAKKSIVVGIPTRTSREGRRISARKKRERQRAHHSDPDIDLEIQQHGEENVHVVYDSDP